MVNKKTNEANDDSIGALIHQGKPISTWEKLLKKDFNLDQMQILALIRSGVDLGRMIQNLDEDDSNIDDKSLFKDEEFFFNEKENNESDNSLKDIVTVGDFIDYLRNNAKRDDKLAFRFDKKTSTLNDLQSKDGTTVIDIIFSSDADRLDEDVELDFEIDNPSGEFITLSDFKRLGQEAYKNSSTAWLLDNVAAIVNGKVIDFSKIKYIRPEGYPSNGTFFLLDNDTASLAAFEKEKDLMLNEKETKDIDESKDDSPFNVADLIDELKASTTSPHLDLVLANVEGNPYVITKVVAKKNSVLLRCKEVNSMNEGRGWHKGGYGGTGQSYRSLGDKAPRGAAIGWYNVDQLDPKAKGKMFGWRCGPSNFPFKDLFFPNRKYKQGTMVMRNKYVNAGPFSGEVYIAIPSYFEIVKTQNPEGLKVLEALKIPLDLTFGMNPNDDYSITYTA